jgi:integrase
MARELERDHLWGRNDPLFPTTEMGLGADGGSISVGLLRQDWATSDPAREIFRKAFEGAGLPYHNPHSFRDMLVRHAMTLDLTPEVMKACSQNLGHADVLTTFTSYGQVPTRRQGELIRNTGERRAASLTTSREEVAAIERMLARVGVGEGAATAVT